MAQFKYFALNSNGKAVTGLVSATDESQAIQDLRDQGIYPTRIDALPICNPFLRKRARRRAKSIATLAKLPRVIASYVIAMVITASVLYMAFLLCAYVGIGIGPNGQCDTCWVRPATRVIDAGYQYPGDSATVLKKVKLCSDCRPPRSVSQYQNADSTFAQFSSAVMAMLAATVLLGVIGIPLCILWGKAIRLTRDFRGEE